MRGIHAGPCNCAGTAHSQPRNSTHSGGRGKKWVFDYKEQNGTCFHMLVDEMRLHDGVAPVEGVLAGRVEVVLQQHPPLVPHAQDVARRRADLGNICRKTISRSWTRISDTLHLIHRNPLQLQCVSGSAAGVPQHLSQCMNMLGNHERWRQQRIAWLTCSSLLYLGTMAGVLDGGTAKDAIVH